MCCTRGQAYQCRPDQVYSTNDFSHKASVYSSGIQRSHAYNVYRNAHIKFIRLRDMHMSLPLYHLHHHHHHDRHHHHCH
jgi:hypothetical protein